jgi:hypothetical protein
MIDYALNSLVANHSAVWPLTCRNEIARALHLAILYGESLREKYDQRSTGKIFTALCYFLF